MDLVFKFEVPYDASLSKNQRFVAGRTTRVNKLHEAAKEKVFWPARGAYMGHHLDDKSKTKIRIVVHRPHFNSDPINFIDGICDAVQDAIKVDDRYFTVELDWVLNKDNPHLEIEVWQ